MTTPVARWNDIYHGNAPWQMTEPVVCKAGEGALFTDPSYRAYCAQADSLHFDAFAYYALHTGTAVEMTAQARRAHMLIGARPAMYDAERWPAESGSPAGMVSLSQLCSAIDAYRDFGGVMNVCYLPREMWREMGAPSLAPLAWRRIHIINAEYLPDAATPGTAAWKPYGGVSPWAVQYKPCHNVAPGTWPDARLVWETGAMPSGSPTGASTVHIVQPGESMASIAYAAGITLHELELANPRAGHPAGHFALIFPGDELVIP